jgi:hypothetical protein
MVCGREPARSMVAFSPSTLYAPSAPWVAAACQSVASESSMRFLRLVCPV